MSNVNTPFVLYETRSEYNGRLDTTMGNISAVHLNSAPDRQWCSRSKVEVKQKWGCTAAVQHAAVQIHAHP